ncbi:hypothetical protein [Kitasatospora griseola]|uniref:hypothetical protein n=1 Tax=Kitasatospora griseola TaxID=2064 RepID=UPI00382BBB53
MSERSESIVKRCVCAKRSPSAGEVGGMGERSEFIVKRCACAKRSPSAGEVGA